MSAPGVATPWLGYAPGHAWDEAMDVVCRRLAGQGHLHRADSELTVTVDVTQMA